MIGIGAIRSYFTKLAFNPKENKLVTECDKIGGGEYVLMRGLEQVSVYRSSKNVADLDIAIQLLTVARLQLHGNLSKE